MIAVAFGCLLLLVAGIVWMFYQENIPGKKYPVNTNVDTDDVTVNSWFNGSCYINTSDQWAYIELTFPSGYVGMGWEVTVYGVENEADREFIYSMDSRVNSYVNGVKLNLDNTRIQQFDCFDIEVSVEDTYQTETVCLGKLEVR